MVRFTDTKCFSPLNAAPDVDETPAVDPPGYTLGCEIGRGGMGVIYRAQDQVMEREVAVKILSRRYGADSRTAQRFVAEAKITGRLQHPGVPAVYHVGRMEDDRPFLVMKLIEGDTLDALLTSSEPLDRLAVFEAVAQAVGYAHAHGVVHRDLKPQNVMVSSFGEVQVMDWGLAKVLSAAESAPLDDLMATPVFEFNSKAGREDSDPENNSIFGTPAYMSPEQAGGEADRVDRRSDVFGLGAIMCTMLTGKPPFGGVDVEAVRLAALNTETHNAFALLAACGAEQDVVNLCKRCLSQRRADRPRDAAAVALEVTRLRAAAADRARLAERALIRAEHLEEQCRQRRWGKCIGAVLAIGLAGTGLGLVLANNRCDRAHEARGAAESRERETADELVATRAKLTILEGGNGSGPRSP